MHGWFETFEWFKAGVRIDIDNLRKYLSIVHTALGEKSREFQERIEQEAIEFDSVTRDEYYAIMSDEHWQLADVLPNLLYQSILVVTYSLLERSLIGLAKSIASKRDIRLQVNDLKYKGIEAARHYMDKVLSISFLAKEDKGWNEIQDLRKIRNNIVHNEGIVIPGCNDYDAIVNYIKRKNGLIKINEFKHIQVEKTYCEYVIDLVKEFIIKIADICETNATEKQVERRR